MFNLNNFKIMKNLHKYIKNDIILQVEEFIKEVEFVSDISFEFGNLYIFNIFQMENVNGYQINIMFDEITTPDVSAKIIKCIAEITKEHKAGIEIIINGLYTVNDLQLEDFDQFIVGREKIKEYKQAKERFLNAEEV